MSDELEAIKGKEKALIADSRHRSENAKQLMKKKDEEIEKLKIKIQGLSHGAFATTEITQDIGKKEDKKPRGEYDTKAPPETEAVSQTQQTLLPIESKIETSSSAAIPHHSPSTPVKVYSNLYF